MKNKYLKAFGIIAKVCWWCVLTALVVMLVSIFSAKIKGEVPSVLGYSVINIISSSMEDEIPKDSYILIKKVDPEEVERDQIICFYSRDPQIYGIPNTHRVIEDPIVTEDGIEFVTKGDANLIPDHVNARGEDLIGVYVKTLDGITSFSDSLSGNTLVVIIIILQMAIGAMFVYTIVVAKGEKDDKKKEK